MALYSRIFVAILILSDVTPETIHTIVPHGNMIRLVHIHLHQVPFSLCWPWKHVLNKKYFPLIFECHFKSGLMLFGHPICAFLCSCVELMPLTTVTDNQGYSDLWFLHHLNHHHWSHCWYLHLATYMTLFHIPTWCLQTHPGRTFFWSLQDIFT